MTNLEFWEVVTNLLSKELMKNFDDASATTEMKNDLACAFERANNELIIASQNSTTYNTHEELLTILKSYQTMIDKDGFKYPTVVINDIKASINYVLEKNNSKGGKSNE